MKIPPPKENCPAPQEPFDRKKFLDIGCYKHDVSSCQDVLESMGIDRIPPGMSAKEAGAALDLIAANTYMARGEGDTLYSINQCVIPESELMTLNAMDCRFGNVELPRSNNIDSDVLWTYPTGCVLTEDGLKTQLPEVLAHITRTFKESKEKLQQNLNNSITDNQQSTQTSWANFGNNNTNAANQRFSATDARRRTRETDNVTMQEANEEVRAQRSARTFEEKANYNELVDRSMMRDCRLATASHEPCGWGWRGWWQYTEHNAVNGGRSCPAASSHWYYGHRPCWEWRHVPVYEWHHYLWSGWHYVHVRNEWRVVQTH